jgi:uncharacterized membrane protein YjgN (DUF898 family)
VFYVTQDTWPAVETASAAVEDTESKNAPTTIQQAGPTEGLVRRFSFHGEGGSLFGIHIVNIFLTLLTFGVYYFWAKVRTRSYLLSQIEFEGDRLAYHGTGKELLIGFIKAALLFGIPYLVLQFLPKLIDTAGMLDVVAGFVSAGLILMLIPFSIISARRYRFSRTSWRGIRLSVRASTDEFIKLFMGGWLLTLITLGVYYPFFETRRYAFLTSRSFVGNRQFEFDGVGSDLSSSFLLAYFLLPFSLGLSWLWFSAKRQRYYWDHTTCGPARFHSTLTGWRFFRLKLGNLLLLVMTLGLAWPWTVMRNLRVSLSNLTLEGPIDLDSIRQDPGTAATTGEGLTQWLDTGFDLG